MKYRLLGPYALRYTSRSTGSDQADIAAIRQRKPLPLLCELDLTQFRADGSQGRADPAPHPVWLVISYLHRLRDVWLRVERVPVLAMPATFRLALMQRTDLHTVCRATVLARDYHLLLDAMNDAACPLPSPFLAMCSEERTVSQFVAHVNHKKSIVLVSAIALSLRTVVSSAFGRSLSSHMILCSAFQV